MAFRIQLEIEKYNYKKDIALWIQLEIKELN